MWIDELRRYTSPMQSPDVANDTNSVTTIVVGNKLDLRHIRSVSTIEAQHMSRSKNAFFIETSALDATNVEKAFNQVVREIYDRVMQRHLARLAQAGAGLESGAQVLRMWQNPRHPVTTRPITIKQNLKQKCKEDIQEMCPKFGCLW